MQLIAKTQWVFCAGNVKCCCGSFPNYLCDSSCVISCKIYLYIYVYRYTHTHTRITFQQKWWDVNFWGNVGRQSSKTYLSSTDRSWLSKFMLSAFPSAEAWSCSEIGFEKLLHKMQASNSGAEQIITETKEFSSSKKPSANSKSGCFPTPELSW